MSKIASPFAKWSNMDRRITKVDVPLLEQNNSALHHSVMITLFLDAKTLGPASFLLGYTLKVGENALETPPAAFWMEGHVRFTPFPVGSVIRNAP